MSTILKYCLTSLLIFSLTSCGGGGDGGGGNSTTEAGSNTQKINGSGQNLVNKQNLAQTSTANPGKDQLAQRTLKLTAPFTGESFLTALKDSDAVKMKYYQIDKNELAFDLVMLEKINDGFIVTRNADLEIFQATNFVDLLYFGQTGNGSGRYFYKETGPTIHDTLGTMDDGKFFLILQGHKIEDGKEVPDQVAYFGVTVRHSFDPFKSVGPQELSFQIFGKTKLQLLPVLYVDYPNYRDVLSRENEFIELPTQLSLFANIEETVKKSYDYVTSTKQKSTIENTPTDLYTILKTIKYDRSKEQNFYPSEDADLIRLYTYSTFAPLDAQRCFAISKKRLINVSLEDKFNSWHWFIQKKSNLIEINILLLENLKGEYSIVEFVFNGNLPDPFDFLKKATKVCQSAENKLITKIDESGTEDQTYTLVESSSQDNAQ